MEAPVDKAPEVAQPSIEDLAAHDFQQLIPAFEKKIEELSNRPLKRVFSALMRYPFEDGPTTFSYQEERELFMLALKISDCKFVLMKAALALKEEDIKTWIDAAKTEATKSEPTGKATVDKVAHASEGDSNG